MILKYFTTKNVFVSLIFILFSCKAPYLDQPKYYYYSETAYLIKDSLINAGWYPTIYHTSVDGIDFTCECSPEYVKSTYSVKFPDVIFVKSTIKNYKIEKHK